MWEAGGGKNFQHLDHVQKRKYLGHIEHFKIPSIFEHSQHLITKVFVRFKQVFSVLEVLRSGRCGGRRLIILLRIVFNQELS